MTEAEKNIIRFIVMFGAAVCVLFLTIARYKNSGENRALSQLIDCCWTSLCLSLPKFNFLKASVALEPTVAKQTWCLSVDRYRRRVQHIYWFGKNIDTVSRNGPWRILDPPQSPSSLTCSSLDTHFTTVDLVERKTKYIMVPLRKFWSLSLYFHSVILVLW